MYNELSNGLMLSIKELAYDIKNKGRDYYNNLDRTQLFRIIENKTLICFDNETKRMKEQCVDYLIECLKGI